MLLLPKAFWDGVCHGAGDLNPACKATYVKIGSNETERTRVAGHISTGQCVTNKDNRGMRVQSHAWLENILQMLTASWGHSAWQSSDSLSKQHGDDQNRSSSKGSLFLGQQ